VTPINDECTDFIATFKAAVNLKAPPSTFIITDALGYITDISSSAIQNFGIENIFGKKN
jgi:hypothetical protein